MHPNKLSFNLMTPRSLLMSDVKPYILEPLDNIKLSRSQYIATSIINYGPYIDNMFAVKDFVYALCRQLSTVITSKTPIPCP